MMKKLLPVVVLLALVGCRRVDMREVTLTIPGLTEANKAQVVEALAKYAGIDKNSYKWDMAQKTLTLKYDSMQLAHTNMRMAIADKGIEVAFPPPNADGRAGHINSH